MAFWKDGKFSIESHYQQFDACVTSDIYTGKKVNDCCDPQQWQFVKMENFLSKLHHQQFDACVTSDIYTSKIVSDFVIQSNGNLKSHHQQFDVCV